MFHVFIAQNNRNGKNTATMLKFQPDSCLAGEELDHYCFVIFLLNTHKLLKAIPLDNQKP